MRQSKTLNVFKMVESSNQGNIFTGEDQFTACAVVNLLRLASNADSVTSNYTFIGHHQNIK